MSDMPRPKDDDRRLIDGLLDGALVSVGSDAADLVTRLEHDAAAREYLLERAALHAGLRQSLRRRSLGAWAVSPANGEYGQSRDAPRVQRGKRSRTSRWLRVAAAVAACVAVALVARYGWDQPYATVTTGIGTAGLAVGREVRTETHDLAAGVLELETCRGVQLVIEAPAAFQFESAQTLRLTRGRIAADVPARARGFTVVTPSGEAIDLGTRFAVDVPAFGDAEVHVFDGEVVARSGGHTPTSLRDGEAFSLTGNVTRELRTAAFIRRGEVAELAAAVEAGREWSSQAAMQRLRDDPALIAVIDFEDETRGARAEERDRPAGQYDVVQGRWPGSQAADFTHVGDHVPLDVGEDADWPQLTLCAWVRLDRLGAPFQSLYHTDGWTGQNRGQVHWMIIDSGVMRLALQGLVLGPEAGEQHGCPESLTSVLGAEGRWVHLAFVYDAVARTASFFIDGRPDGVITLADAPPARLGQARVGNWDNRDRKLSGRIDELVFVGRALSAGEIRSLYEAGTPYLPSSPRD